MIAVAKIRRLAIITCVFAECIILRFLAKFMHVFGSRQIGNLM